MSEGPLRAFLFTDLVGSSAQWDNDSQAMSAALQRHDALAVRAVADSGGMVFKHSGDGTCAVFDTPSDAVAAAVALQRALTDDPVLTLRMGIHFGPAETRDGDWFGATLNRAARTMGLADGGQVLLSQAAAALIDPRNSDGVSVHRLGSVRLRGLVEPETVYQVVADGLARDFPTLAGLAVDTLPWPRTSFLGRENEIESLCASLGEERLVTIAGVGGTGKTRLSIEVGRAVLDRFADGVLFVALSDIDDEEGVVAAIAADAGVQQGSMFGLGAGDPRAAFVLRALQQRDVLIVLDNCEHLLDAVADVVDEILDECPGVRILATSRESLSVTGERVWRVPMLDDVTALALVLARARDKNAAFDLSEEERVVAVELCRRLDCLPLAIELAAARFATMSVADVAARLDDRFRLLAGRGRRQDRHATMRATLDWSYDLLDDDERLVLDRLSVFVGGFGLDAAEQVCADASMVSMRVIDLLGSLVDKSLVEVGDRNGQRRFDLLETVRAYAAERLGARGETEATPSAHANWCQGFAAATWAARAAGSNVDDEVEAESDNCRAAHDWATETETTETALWIASATSVLWANLGKATEGLRRCEDALALPGGSALARHLCTAAAAVGAVWLFEREKAWELALQALETIEASSVPPYLAWMTAAFARGMIGDDPEGPTFREIIEQLRTFAFDDAGVARADAFEGQALLQDGNVAEAIPVLEKAVRSYGDNSNWAHQHLLVCRWATESGTVPLGEIRVRIEQATDPLLSVGYQFLEALSLAEHGEPVGDAINEILRSVRSVGVGAMALADGFGSLAAALGEHRTAAMLYGPLNTASGYFFRVRMQPKTQAALGGDEYDRLAAIGASMNDAEYEALAQGLGRGGRAQ